ncbi:uncharacterized protein LOC144468782 [Augochlora pura]
MAPIRRTRSSSRRSSILKPSKPRQPLQNLNVTSLSTESSPVTTTKLKRRVSFAETKHVKEFCNSLEQGTVWDNTYEEHDISHLNVPYIPNKVCDVENVYKTNVEIRTDHYNDVRYSNSQTVDKLVITETNICFTRDKIVQESLIAIDHEEICRGISREIETTYKQVTKKGILLDASPIINCDTIAKTNEHAVHPGNTNNDTMEISTVVSTKPYSSQDSIIYQQNMQNFNNISREMTVELTTGLCNLQRETSNVGPIKDLRDVSIKQIVAVPTTSDILQEEGSYAEPNKNCSDVSMEMTSAIPTTLCSLQKDTSYAEPTKNFKDVSMEITGEVPTVSYNLQGEEPYVIFSKNHNDISMEMTTAVPTRPYSLQKETLWGEPTKNFKDVSMEMTAAVPTRPCSLQKETCAESAKNTEDVSMEMTGAVPTVPYNLQGEEPYTISSKNHNDVSMEMTTGVPTRPYSLQKETLWGEPTKNFKDVSMEMTAAVPTRPCSLQKETLCAEPTKNFKDTSMEMTTAVSTKLCSSQEDALPAEHIENFKDLSMEMTAAVPTRPYSLQNETCAEPTKNFKDVSMEMTTAVATKLCSFQEGALSVEHIKNFKDVSMDMSIEIPIESHNLKKVPCMESNKNYNDISMEMTTAVPSRLRSLEKDTSLAAYAKVTYDLQELRYNNDKTTTICHDATVDMLQIHSSDSNMESEKNKIVGNNLMEVRTEVPFLNEMNMSGESVEYCKNNTNIQESKEIVFIPKISMKITEAVPSLHSIPQKTDAVMNISEVRQRALSEGIDNRTSSRDSLNQITISDNILKDITSLVVPSLSNSSESSREKNCTINKSENSEDKIIKEPTSSELPSLVNIETHTTMHDSLMQENCASAFNKNNTGMACATPNTASNDFLHTAMPDISQGTFLSHEHSRDILTHPRRTYTINPLCTDHSSSNIINEHSKNLGTANDVENMDSFQAQSSFENYSSFFNRTLEQLESINPPSFLCLDNSAEHISVNTNYSQKTETEKKIIEDLPEITECGKTQKLDLQEAVNESGKQSSLETSCDNSPSTIVKDLQCSSSTINKSQKVSSINVISPPRNKNMHNNFNIENETMEQSVLNKDPCDAYSEENHLQNDEHKLHKNAMEIELEEIDPHGSLVDKDVTIALDPFSSLLKELHACAESDTIIWKIYHENIEKKMFIAGFMSCSLLVVIYLCDNYDVLGNQFIKDIKMKSCLPDDADDLISIVHKLILEKIDVRKLINLYKSFNDILPMLDHVSKEVKLAMEFMFELKRLRDRNLMDITRDSVSFVSLTKKMDIILRVTVIIKPFEKIESEDIDVQFLVGSSGSVRDEVIKKLLKNIKKDHNFLRRFINDVRDYIYLMEVCDAPAKVSY